jgi:hypothetical protein
MINYHNKAFILNEINRENKKEYQKVFDIAFASKKKNEKC